MVDFVTKHYDRETRSARLSRYELEICIQAISREHQPRFAVSVAREKLAGHLQPLVKRCAIQLQRRGRVLDADFHDLVQAGNVGLMLALDSWKPRGAKLATWCAWQIKREMARENDTNTGALSGAAAADVVTYTEEPTVSNSDEHEESAVADYAVTEAADPEILAAAMEERAVVEAEIARLTGMQQEVLRHVFWGDLSTRGTAQRMKISHTRVAQILAAVLDEFTLSQTLGNLYYERLASLVSRSSAETNH